MLKPGGSFSLPVGSLSAADGRGGDAIGASLAAAAFPSGRPINGDPGGSAGAAAGAAAGGADAGGCWENAGAANRTPAIVPASKMERPAVTRGIIEFLPKEEALDSRGPCENGPGARPLRDKFPPFAVRLQSETGNSA